MRYLSAVAVAAALCVAAGACGRPADPAPAAPPTSSVAPAAPVHTSAPTSTSATPSWTATQAPPSSKASSSSRKPTPTRKSAARDTGPGCGQRAVTKGKFNPNCKEYQGYLDPGGPGRGKTSGDLQHDWACEQGYLPKDEC